MESVLTSSVISHRWETPEQYTSHFLMLPGDLTAKIFRQAGPELRNPVSKASPNLANLVLLGSAHSSGPIPLGSWGYPCMTSSVTEIPAGRLSHSSTPFWCTIGSRQAGPYWRCARSGCVVGCQLRLSYDQAP